jgi:sarcosine oxidase, subunit gamma
MAELPPWLKKRPPALRLILQGDGEVQAAAAAAWGVAFPREACRAVLDGQRAVLWLGPEEFLLWDVSREHAHLIDSLEQALSEHPHSLVDVSHRQLGLEISGPQAAEILNGACPLNLSLEAFPVNMCTRTVFAKAEVLLWRLDDDVFYMEIWNSFEGYVTGLLTEIGLDYDIA